MAKFKVEFDKAACIGAAQCESVSPQFWKVMNDGKAHLNGSITIGEKMEELLVEEKDLQANLNAANVCPVKAIRIRDLESGEILV